MKLVHLQYLTLSPSLLHDFETESFAIPLPIPAVIVRNITSLEYYQFKTKGSGGLESVHTNQNTTYGFFPHLLRYSVPEIRFVLAFFECQPGETKYKCFVSSNNC